MSELSERADRIPTTIVQNDELDLATEEALKGDAIGSTMYSERFVLKTMLKLVDIEWNSELEEDLCALWDMSAEEDVVRLFIEHDFVQLASHVIVNNSESRLVEIMVGIIGNMCCLKNVCEHLLSSSLINVFIELIEKNDSLVLIQVFRLIQAVLFHISDSEALEPILSQVVICRTMDIFSTAKNIDLLKLVIDVTSHIMYDVSPEVFTSEFYSQLAEGFKEIFKNYEKDIEMSGFLNDELLKLFEKFLKSFSCICNIDTTESKSSGEEFFAAYEVFSTTLSFEIPFDFFDKDILDYIDILCRTSTCYYKFYPPMFLNFLKLFNMFEKEQDLQKHVIAMIVHILSGLSNDELFNVFESSTKSDLATLSKIVNLIEIGADENENFREKLSKVLDRCKDGISQKTL